MQHLRGFKADAWMSVGMSIGSVVRDNTGCIMSHALGVHMVDINGNTFFEGPLSAPQVDHQHNTRVSNPSPLLALLFSN